MSDTVQLEKKSPAPARIARLVRLRAVLRDLRDVLTPSDEGQDGAVKASSGDHRAA